MKDEYLSMSMSALAGRWWAMVAKGSAAILFGVLILVTPQIGLLALILMWGAYALADGAFGLTMAVRQGRGGRSWGWILFQSLVSLAAGVGALVWPRITGVALLAIIAAWALVSGVSEIVGAIRLRKYIQGEWRLALAGALSIAFGVLLLARPAAGALAVAWLIGGCAIFFGALRVALGLRLHAWHKGVEQSLPAGSTLTPTT